MAEFNIGFIGLGTMGEPMCKNVLKGTGETVFVYDINDDQVKILAGAGATACSSIKEVAEKSNLIIIMVPNNDNVRDVINELLPNLKKGTIVMDMSTISPSVSREMAEKVKDTGSVMIDAPVVKSKGAAIAGTLGILVGGDKEILAKVRPILEMMGEEVTYMGGNGNGLVLKLVHNMLVGNIQNGVNEAILMGQKAGLDFDAMIKGIKSGGGQNFYMDVKADSIKNRDFEIKFSVKNMHKDVWLHKKLADQLKLDLPGSDRVRDVYDKAVDDFPQEDFSATIKVVEEECKEE
mgnify:FL=1